MMARPPHRPVVAGPTRPRSVGRIPGTEGHRRVSMRETGGSTETAKRTVEKVPRSGAIDDPEEFLMTNAGAMLDTYPG